MLKYLKFIKESKEPKSSIKEFKTEHSRIRYKEYEDSVINFMGSYVDKNFRGQGIFNKMLDKLFKKFKGKDVYIPISNDKIINHFLKLGFSIYDKPIRYWGKPENCINVHKKIT
jgi:predicted GNAT family acetyltransferase